MTRMIAFVLATGLALPAFAGGHSQAEKVEKIMAMLAEMQCEMDEDDIEFESDGIELDDVFCADGQYDFELNNDLEIVEKRKE